MKKIYVLLLMASGMITNMGFAQTGSVMLIPPSGTPVGYSSITAAYAAIPGPLTGNYLIEFGTAYNGSSEAYPIQLTDRGLVVGGYTITVRPAAGNNGAIIKRLTAAIGDVIQLNGGDNIILDGRPGGILSNFANYLSVNDPYSGSSSNRLIEFLNGANNNMIRYVKTNAADATADGSGARNIAITAGNRNTVTNCVTTGGLRGIQDFGLDESIPNTGNIIQNDTVRNFGEIGTFGGNAQKDITIQNNYVSLESYNVPVIEDGNVFVTGIQQQSFVAGNSNILNNTISMVNTSTSVLWLSAISDIGRGTSENITGNNIIAMSTPASTIPGFSTSIFGINTNGTGLITVSKNKISGLSSPGPGYFFGIIASPYFGSTANVNNNFISITAINANAIEIVGLSVGSSNVPDNNTSNIHYNSIRIGGVQAVGNAANAYCLYKDVITAGSSYNQKNNIAIMQRSGGTGASFVGFYTNGVAGINEVNYNTYFATDSAGNGYAAGGWNGSLYRNNSLAAYQISAGTKEQNSTFANVSFMSATDLYLAPPSSTATSLYGIPITGITTDIDGQFRSAVSPFRGADEPGVIQPVELISFTGEARESYNLVQWRTATELNNKGFSLERSVDGVHFTSITFIKSKAPNGNSFIPVNYSFNDIKPLSTKVFYRLKQVDNDGKFTYSTIIIISGKVPAALTVAGLYPNPVVNSLTLVIKTPIDKQIWLTVTDAAGKMMMQKSMAVQAGETMVTLPATSYAPGIYLITIKDNSSNESITTRFIK